jgi:hypothetical protein
MNDPNWIKNTLQNRIEQENDGVFESNKRILPDYNWVNTSQASVKQQRVDKKCAKSTMSTQYVQKNNDADQHCAKHPIVTLFKHDHVFLQIDLI